jgi:hypothetical protein
LAISISIPILLIWFFKASVLVAILITIPITASLCYSIYKYLKSEKEEQEKKKKEDVVHPKRGITWSYENHPIAKKRKVDFNDDDDEPAPLHRPSRTNVRPEKTYSSHQQPITSNKKGYHKYSNEKQCVTCNRWQGERSISHFRDKVEFDAPQDKGQCVDGDWNRTQTRAIATCKKWVKWAVLK